MTNWGKFWRNYFLNCLDKKNSGQINVGIEITNQTLKKELGFDLQDLLDIPTEKFIETLTKQNNLTNENLEKIAEILLLIADNQENDNKQLLEKCLTIYEYLENVDNIYSLDRYMKINRIKNEL